MPDTQHFELILVAEEHVEIRKPLRVDFPHEAAGFLHETLGRSDRERFGVLLLDVQRRLIGYHIAHVGVLDHVKIEPAAVFVPALLANACSIVLFHTHPSGDPAPSQHDLQVTRRLEACGMILGVEVIDHIILGEPPTFMSLARRS